MTGCLVQPTPLLYVRSLSTLLSFLLVCVLPPSLQAQTYLKPGFDKGEYLEVLRIAGHIADSSIMGDQPPPPMQYQFEYRSAEIGLKNQWQIWIRKDQRVGVISLRGTVAAAESWLENFYAAMVPATGSLQLNDSTPFNYQLAESAAATVHVGWLLGIAYMAPGIAERIKSWHQKGVKEFIITGHSQGGALAFLLRSWLHYQTKAGALPADITYKSYCSAAPKPGNMQYVYDYDFITRVGWSYTVVNAKDWVPETPFSLQSLQDFNTPNPFGNVDGALKKQPLLVRWYLNHSFNSMNRVTRKSQKRFQKYLGRGVYKQVKKFLPQFKQPDYAPGSNYMRAGAPVILMPDEQYAKEFVSDGKNVFLHHMPVAYYKLMLRQNL
ncbi:lipase family protein [Paraflavitalea sp. CAU 1676]|uniref:lipase family protein n=1 Tax=Paraflavitalea sp. CAU 1676 TaxID=3032598 RepID=UPI0023DC425B|nr:lipase family protein [Paraflavitalea sp. CAU 1676]MDF2187863.1 lipase family protein [Paraflavitalea sp. CAU 1676]